MPITIAPPSPSAKFASREDNMFAARMPVEDPAIAPEPTSRASAWAALAGISTWKGIGDAIYAPHFDEDPAFDPFEHIRKTPSLIGDPVIGYLVERGQFDSARNADDFQYRLNNGREFIKDAQTVAKSSHPFMLQLLGGLADPLNVAALAAAPFTAGTSLLGTGGGTLATVGRIAAVGAVSNVASHELQTALQPVSNEPGAGDELAAGLTGAAFGGGIGWITHGLGPQTRGVPTQTMQRIRRGVDELIRAELPSAQRLTPVADEIKGRPTPVPPPEHVPDADFHTPLAEVPDEVLARRPEPDQIAAGEDPPPFDSITGDIAARTDAPLGMLTGLDEAIARAEGAATPNFPGRRPDVEATPLTGDRLDEAQAIQERLMAPRTPKTWHGRPGFVINPFAKSPKPPAPPPRPTVPTMTLDDALAHELDHGYTPFLADAPEAHRTLFVLDNATPAITAAQDAIRAKYAAAGVPLNEVPHPLQGFNDLVQAARQLTKDPAWNVAATAAELQQGGLSRVVQAAEKAGMKLVNPMTPGGRVLGESASSLTPDAVVSRLDDAYRTLAGSAQTVTRGNAVSPFTHFSPTAAEAIKGIISHQKDLALLDLRNIYAAGGRGKDVLEYGQTKISTRFGFGKFKEAVADYYRTMNAKAGGYDVNPPKNVDPAIIRAADRLKEHFNGQRDRMARVGMLEYDTASLGRVNTTLKRRRAITDKYRQAIATEKAGANDAAKIARLEKWKRSSAAKENRLADRARTLKFSAARHEWYLPRVYDIPTIRRNAEAFTTDLERAFYNSHNTDRSGSRIINPEQRPLLAGVADKIDRKALEADIRKLDPTFSFSGSASTKSGTSAQVQEKVLYEAIAEMTEGDLSPALRQAYRDQLTAYYRGRAKGAFESIAGRDAEGTRQLADRGLYDMDETILDRWTETDLERLIHRSHHAIDGRYAIREAIRLNPEMNGKTLSSGRAVKTEDDLVAYATDLPDLLLRRMGEKNENPYMVDPAFRQSLEGFRGRAERDIGGIVKALTGTAVSRPEGRLLPGADFMGRQLLKLQFLSKMGGAAWNTINDLAPISIYMGTHPRLWGDIPRSIFLLKGLPTRDLHAIDAGFDGLIRSRMLGDIDLEAGGIGIEGSTLRKATSALDNATNTGTDIMAKVSLLNAITNVQKRMAGVVTIDYGTSLSKRLIKAANIAGRNADEATRNAALIKAGLGERYDVARLNKMGFNVDTAMEYHRQVYKHGLMRDDSPVSKKYATFDDYLEAEDFVKPNFDEWDAAAGDTKLRIMAGMSNEVNRFYVVTPGVADIPLWQARYPTVGRLLNQFQTFGMAFGNQRLAAIGQMPLKYQAGHIGMYLMLGGLAEAIKNHLSGRRSFDDTAALWNENPLGALYGAWNTSGLSTWLQRPLAIADNMNVPFSPGVMTGNVTGASASRYYNAMTLGSLAGPVGSDLERFARLIPPASNSLAEAIGMQPTGDGWDTPQTQSAWKMAPFQNLFWFRLAHKFGGLPVVPEALSER